MPKLSFVAAVIGLTFSSLACAGWMTTTKDDIFSGGQTAMLIGEIDAYHALIFDCDSENLTLSLIEQSKWKEGMGRGNWRLLVKVDQSQIRDFAAQSSQRNEKYIQVATSDRDSILELLKEIRDANTNIQIGMQVKEADFKWSGTASPSGSTRETDRFLQACKLK